MTNARRLDARPEPPYVRRVIRLVPGETDTKAAARIRKVVWRWLVVEAETIEHFRATWPSFRDWLALLDGEPVGIGACGPLPGEEESAAAFAVNSVLREARGQGVGTAIYRQVSEHARSLGKSELQTVGFRGRPWRSGLRRASRVCRYRPNARAATPARGLPTPLDRPPGRRRDHHSCRAPELARGVWETVCEAMADIPYDGDVPRVPAPSQSSRPAPFRVRSYIPEATFVAVQDSEVVGYGRLGWMDRAAGIGDHKMLAVRRAWRGRGIAKALKAAQIAWALDNGLSELRTGNEERNAAARAVNANFPYTPLPDQLLYRGPLATA